MTCFIPGLHFVVEEIEGQGRRMIYWRSERKSDTLLEIGAGSAFLICWTVLNLSTAMHENSPGEKKNINYS